MATWGLVHCTSFTVPVIVTTFSLSNIAVEWCAATGDARTASSKTAESATAPRVDAFIGGSLLRRDSIPADVVLDRHIGGVAVRIGSLCKGPFETNTFDDVVLARPLSEIDSGRPPRLRQNLRGDDLEVVVQRVRALEVDMLDDSQIAVVGNSHSLADRDIGLRNDAHPGHNEGNALPMTDRVPVTVR